DAGDPLGQFLPGISVGVADAAPVGTARLIPSLPDAAVETDQSGIGVGDDGNDRDGALPDLGFVANGVDQLLFPKEAEGLFAKAGFIPGPVAEFDGQRQIGKGLPAPPDMADMLPRAIEPRSEERRVGKERRFRWRAAE